MPTRFNPSITNQDTGVNTNEKVSPAIIQIGVLVAGVLVALGIAFYLTATGNMTTSSQTVYKNFCSKYDSMYVVPCATAVESALEKYTGQVKSVEILDMEKVLSVPYPDKFWKIGINLKTPIKLEDTITAEGYIEIIVNTRTGDLKIYKFTTV